MVSPQDTAEHLDVSNLSESHTGHWCWGAQARTPVQHLKNGFILLTKHFRMSDI